MRRISELIAALSEIQREHGDLSCRIAYDGAGINGGWVKRADIEETSYHDSTPIVVLGDGN